jgi:hypothetical protein
VKAIIIANILQSAKLWFLNLGIDREKIAIATPAFEAGYVMCFAFLLAFPRPGILIALPRGGLRSISGCHVTATAHPFWRFFP